MVDANTAMRELEQAWEIGTLPGREAAERNSACARCVAMPVLRCG